MIEKHTLQNIGREWNDNLKLDKFMSNYIFYNKEHKGLKGKKY